MRQKKLCPLLKVPEGGMGLSGAATLSLPGLQMKLRSSGAGTGWALNATFSTRSARQRVFNDGDKRSANALIVPANSESIL